MLARIACKLTFFETVVYWFFIVFFSDSLSLSSLLLIIFSPLLHDYLRSFLSTHRFQELRPWLGSEVRGSKRAGLGAMYERNGRDHSERYGP